MVPHINYERMWVKFRKKASGEGVLKGKGDCTRKKKQRGKKYEIARVWCLRNNTYI